MRKIDLSQPPSNFTVMVHGAMGAGKTRFAASWPKPRFLSDLSERGYETIRTMGANNFYDPKVAPQVWGIEHPKDMLEAIRQTTDDVAQKKSDAPLTLVVDSITFYANLFFDAMARTQTAGKEDTRKLYGDLLQHLRRIMISTHEIPINVVWLALTKPPEDGVAGLMIPGQSAGVLPAACQYFMFMRAFSDGPKNITKFEMRTRPFGPYPARCRDGGILPDPLPDPTYRSFIECLTKTPVGTTTATTTATATK